MESEYLSYRDHKKPASPGAKGTYGLYTVLSSYSVLDLLNLISNSTLVCSLPVFLILLSRQEPSWLALAILCAQSKTLLVQLEENSKYIQEVRHLTMVRVKDKLLRLWYLGSNWDTK